MVKLTYTHGLSFLVKLLINNKALEIKSSFIAIRPLKGSSGRHPAYPHPTGAPNIYSQDRSVYKILNCQETEINHKLTVTYNFHLGA